MSDEPSGEPDYTRSSAAAQKDHAPFYPARRISATIHVMNEVDEEDEDESDIERNVNSKRLQISAEAAMIWASGASPPLSETTQVEAHNKSQMFWINDNLEDGAEKKLGVWLTYLVVMDVTKRQKLDPMPHISKRLNSNPLGLHFSKKICYPRMCWKEIAPDDKYGR